MNLQDFEEGRLKCLDCLMCVRTQDGIWCLKFMQYAGETMAKKCEHFIGDDVLDSMVHDYHERKDF